MEDRNLSWHRRAARGGSDGKQKQHELATSVINASEIYAGMKEEERLEVERLLKNVAVFEVTEPIAMRSSELRKAWRKRGFVLGLMDTLIAATALERGFQLMTSNVKHFPMEGLVLFPVPMIP